MNRATTMRALPSPDEMKEVGLPLGGVALGSIKSLTEVAFGFAGDSKESCVEKGGKILEKILQMDSGITDIQIRTEKPIRTQRGSEVSIFEGHGKTPLKEVAGIALALYRSKNGARDRKQDSQEVADAELMARLPVEDVVDFAAEGGGVMDSAFALGRLRIQIFFDMSGLAISIRVLADEILPLSKLGFSTETEEQLRELVMMRSGLGIVTGQTGSGKSTTLAALIDYVRTNANRHIETIEEPVEYRYSDTRSEDGVQCVSLVTQREVGIHCSSFKDGLVHSLRHHPNLIMIGEIRDEATMETCLAAVQTGHLVLTTLHTNGATDTISRILEFFPPAKENAVLKQLSASLNFVLTQGLFSSRKKQGSYTIVYELFVNRRRSSRASILKYLDNKSSIESEMNTNPNVRWDDCLQMRAKSGEIGNEDVTANQRTMNTDGN
jgi:twitching motility protein PilT